MSKSNTIWATIAGVLSSIFAFLGLVGCCGLPILAGILAWLGIGASQLSFFAAYRWWFIGFAIVALLFGFWQVYFKRNSSCCEPTENKCCAGDAKKTKSQLFRKIFLWLGAIIVVSMLAIGFLESNNALPLPAGECCPEPESVQPAASCCPSK